MSSPLAVRKRKTSTKGEKLPKAQDAATVHATDLSLVESGTPRSGASWPLREQFNPRAPSSQPSIHSLPERGLVPSQEAGMPSMRPLQPVSLFRWYNRSSADWAEISLLSSVTPGAEEYTVSTRADGRRTRHRQKE